MLAGQSIQGTHIFHIGLPFCKVLLLLNYLTTYFVCCLASLRTVGYALSSRQWQSIYCVIWPTCLHFCKMGLLCQVSRRSPPPLSLPFLCQLTCLLDVKSHSACSHLIGSFVTNNSWLMFNPIVSWRCQCYLLPPPRTDCTATLHALSSSGSSNDTTTWRTNCVRAA